MWRDVNQKDKEKTTLRKNVLWYCNIRPLDCFLLKTWKTYLVYLDDIISIGNKFEEYLENNEEIFKEFMEANLKLNLVEYSFIQQEFATGRKTDLKL